MILFHICCAPCLSKSLSGYRREIGVEDSRSVPAKGFFYNPNIHPLIEFRRRIKALAVYGTRDPFSLYIDKNYGLEYFLDELSRVKSWQSPVRCVACLTLRLLKTAEKAAEEKCEAFTSTLCASKEQNREILSAAGQNASNQTGVPFLWRDWRGEEAPAKWMNGVYRQQWCGCIFSEYDRYKDTTKHV